MTCRCVALKCKPALTPLLGPRKDASSVKLLTSWNSFHMTTRAADSLLFCTLKLQSSNPNISMFSLNSLHRKETNHKSHHNNPEISFKSAVFHKNNQNFFLHWEYLLFISFLRLCLIIAKHENVPPSWVAMEVTVEEYITTFKRALHHEFCMVVDRVEFGRCSNPLTVQIVAH